MTDSSASDTQETSQKRSSTAAGLSNSNNNSTSNRDRPVKRRASKACQCCRARKVRCNVVEHGAPCTNCRLDEVECIVTESKRRKKLWGAKLDAQKQASQQEKDGILGDATAATKLSNGHAHGHPHEEHGLSPVSSTRLSLDGGVSDREREEHVPHLIYRTQSIRNNFKDSQRRATLATSLPLLPLIDASPTLSASNNNSFLPSRFLPKLSYDGYMLPSYLKPLPARIAPDDVEYLSKKGALTIPEVGLRNELLRSFIEYVYPYMPLMDLHDFLAIIERGNGSNGRLSLLLFQAVMFAGTAFVDMEHLENAGYMTRKAARKVFFQKARLLYDFDYEHDRIALVQALLLMTYWYETPDDQKDTWHWMGVAISLSHTIGLHRNPGKSRMEPKRQKLWKRIWWSCFMRDRLVALGMRRPTRIKSEDYDVPMLTLDDFEIAALDPSILCITQECRLARDTDRQRKLALMCIEKAKLCVCISHVLSAQYSVLNHHQGVTTAEGNTTTTMMLLPRKSGAETCEVRACDEELSKWMNDLPKEAVYRSPGSEPVDDVLIVHRALLHMVYCTTLSALHRPQVLPSAPAAWPARNSGAELHEISRAKVRHAAAEITQIGKELRELDLVKYLPTTGVTVLLPAIIIHLLDIKSSDEKIRNESLLGFNLCMLVIYRLRDNYAAADYATHFLEAAIRKANIQAIPSAQSSTLRQRHGLPADMAGLMDAGSRIDLNAGTPGSSTLDFTNALTPPPDRNGHLVASPGSAGEFMASKLSPFMSASTPPESENSSMNTTATNSRTSNTGTMASLLSAPTTNGTPFNTTTTTSSTEPDLLESFLDLPPYPTDPFFGHHYDEDGGQVNVTGMHAGESAGFGFDVDYWMNFGGDGGMDLGAGVGSAEGMDVDQSLEV